MKYTMIRLFLVAVSSCVVALAGNSASAGWGLLHGGGSSGGAGYGSYGSSGGYAVGYGSSGGYGSTGGYGSSGGYGAYSGYGSSGGYGYGSSGGSSGTAAVAYGSSGGGHGPGPLRRALAGIHDHIQAKHARRAAYGSSGGSSGYATSYGSSGSYVSSYGSSGGYGAGYGSSGYSTSYGSSGGYGAGYGSSGYSTSYGSTGASYSSGYLGVSTQSPASVGMLASHADQGAEAIYLNVSVPAAAKVYVNDMPTTSTGISRQYVSRGLVPGKSYKFDVRAEVVAADGSISKEAKTVTLTAGQREDIQFVSLADTRVQTVVTLKVPEGAKVILAGNETSATGATRTYRTSQLKAGDRWDDYVVEVQHDGKVKRETLRLVAGDDISLTFNFSDDQSLVASR